MKGKPQPEFFRLFSILFLASLLLASCASAPEKMAGAALQGNVAEMDDLLRSDGGAVDTPIVLDKASAACPGERRLTPLQAASCAGHEAVVKKLLDGRANPNLTTQTGRTPLSLALNNGRLNVIRPLVEGGARPDAADSGGNTALMFASKRGDRSLAEFLLKKGASPHYGNLDGETPLMTASDAGIVKMLLDAGADPMRKNRRGESALQIGIRSGDAAIAALFREIQERAGEEVDREMAAGDRAAEQGRFDEAGSRYTAAIAKAAGLGGPAVMDARVRVLQKVNGLPEPPSLSEKAREHLVRSSYILKNSQNLDQAEKEMAAAIDADPWWLDGYYNIGILQAKLNRFAVAEENLAAYIAAAPPGPKTQGAQDKIYEIRLAREEADKIRGVTGQWKDASGATYSVAIDGNSLKIHSGSQTFSLTINNNNIKGSVEGGARPGPHGCTLPGQIHPVNGKLDPDANGMSLEYLWSRYDTKFHYVNMLGQPVAGNCLTCDTKCDAVNIIATNTVNLRLYRLGGGSKDSGPATGSPGAERMIMDRSQRNLPAGRR